VDRVQLKQTDLVVSRVCLGTMTFGGQTGEAAAGRMIDRCLEAGVNFIDTANVYNKGASESILGRVLKGRRGSVVLASKVRGKMGEGPDESGLSRAAILRAIDESLRRLQTDYLDLYYLHLPDYAAPLEESLAAMDELVRAGKVRYPASSNYAAWQVVRMLWLAEDSGYRPAAVTQPMYNLLARGIEQEYMPMCREMGISTVVYNPLAGGLLTGKQGRDAPLPGTRFENNQLYLDRYWHPAQFDAVDELRRIAERAGRSLVSLSLNWLYHHTQADCVILGASRVQQLEQNLNALEEGPLAPETVAACDAVWAKLRGVTPNYNR
jgi:aryl-alcohol dehydrogenase-like predicted oxidoreductase